MSARAESKPGEVQAAVLYAITRAGYRHIDCAAIYENEGEVGAALTEAFTKWDIKREEVRRTLWECYLRAQLANAADNALCATRSDLHYVENLEQ